MDWPRNHHSAQGRWLGVAAHRRQSPPVPPPHQTRSGDAPHRGDAVLLLLVELDPDLLRAERVNVMIPRNLLGRIDAVSGGNRPHFLVEAAEAKLAS